jgi:phage terminase large subunit-like protein
MLYPAQYTPPLTEDFITDGDRLLELMRLAYRDMDNKDGDLQLDEWQAWLIRAMLERYPTNHPDPTKAGKLRWRQCVISLPRQSGKSLIAAGLALNHLVFGQGQCLGMASNLEQSLIIYNRVLQAILANPALKKRFKKTTERRGIVSKDGFRRYDVLPAKEASVQGVPIETAILDEGHLAKRGIWTALNMAIAAKAEGCVYMITTAGDESSETLIDLYKQGERAVMGDVELERFGFFNWTAPEGADVKDPNAILASNPAVECGRIPLDRIMADIVSIPEHEARRYRLNQFVSGTADSWLPIEYYHQCTGQGVTGMDELVLGIDVSGNLDYATIAIARRNGELIETELVAALNNPTENQIYDLTIKLVREHKIKALAMDGRRNPNLSKRLKLNGFPVWQLYNQEVAAACSQGYAQFQTGVVRHNNDPLLFSQMPRAVAKYVGESWYLSSRESYGPIDAIRATLFAMYLATSKESSSIGVF